MRLVMLYLRSRRVGWAALTVALLAVGSWLGTAWSISRPEFGEGTGSLRLLLVFTTLAASSIIGTGAGSPFGEAERTAPRSLSPLRFGHLAGLILFAAALFVVVLLSFGLEGAQLQYPLPALLRNLAGLCGMALLTARLLGARLSWTVPLVFVMASYLGARLPDDTFAAWAWPMQPGWDGVSWAVAVALIVAGLAVVCLHGARETVGENE